MCIQQERRGRGCSGCSGERCGGCRPGCGFDAYNSGTTAVVSLIDMDASTVTTAWAGDSRAVLGAKRAVRASSVASREDGGGRDHVVKPHGLMASDHQDGGDKRDIPVSGNRPSREGASLDDQGDAGRHGSGWEAFDLSNDHKPDRPDELRRIRLSGGRVSPSGSGGEGQQGPVLSYNPA